jgi:hypothetical protein
MNNGQRKQLQDIAQRANSFPEAEDMQKLSEEEKKKLVITVGEIKDDVRKILDEEQEKFDNLPDSLRDGSKGDDLQNVIDELQNAVYELEYAEGLSLSNEDWAEEVVTFLSTAADYITGV